MPLVILYHYWKYLIFYILEVHLPFHGHTKLIAPHHPLADNKGLFPLFLSNDETPDQIVLLLIPMSMTLYFMIVQSTHSLLIPLGFTS